MKVFKENLPNLDFDSQNSLLRGSNPLCKVTITSGNGTITAECVHSPESFLQEWKNKTPDIVVYTSDGGYLLINKEKVITIKIENI